MERLTKRIASHVYYTQGKYEETIPAEMETNDIRNVLKKLAEYEDAEEQGLLPRFHLGDEFWTIRLGKVLKAKVVMLQQKKDGSWQYRFSQEITPEYHDTHNYKESEFGKRFFLTKEEAEQALERMEKENGNSV